MKIALGFDGSSSEDWTAIRAETRDGWQFTPWYGPDMRPTIWNPADWGGEIPRAEVHAAVEQIFRDHDVARMYCDPKDWQSEIDSWAMAFGQEVVVQWPTNQPNRICPALQRFVVDLKSGRLTHDDCKITEVHAGNARRKPIPGDRYVIEKPHGESHRKIDALMASIVAHEAASDARTAGWADDESNWVVILR